MAEQIKLTGIVLRSSEHTIDAARLLDIFSPDKGRISAVIRGVAKPKAKLASASQPFCFGEFMLAQKGNFYTVTDCSIIDSFFGLTYNFDCYVLASSLLEITSKVTLSGQENLEMFTLLLNSLKVLVYERAEPTAITIKFLIETLKKSGFGFDVSECSVCGKALSNQKQVGLMYEGSGAVCTEHSSRVDHIMLDQSEWGILKNINNFSVEEISGMKFASREALTSCLKLMLKQFYYRTGEKIKALDKYF